MNFWKPVRLFITALLVALGLAIASLPVLPYALRGVWSRALLWCLGVRLVVLGEAGRGGLIVANHVSWLDVMAITAVWPDAAFVCKQEIASWPLLGWLLKRAGTFFMRRASAWSAWRAVLAIGPRLREGANAAVFPEGTTTQGDGVLPFYPALFQAAVNAGSKVQPVALLYSGAEAAYTGDTSFGESLATIAGATNLSVTIALPPAFSAAGLTRRQAAQRAHDEIASCLRHLEVAEPSHDEPILRAA